MKIYFDKILGVVRERVGLNEAEVKKLIKSTYNSTGIIDGEVDRYDDLPVPSSDNVDEVWLVKNPSGTIFINRHKSGLYKSDGSKWIFLNPNEIWSGNNEDIWVRNPRNIDLQNKGLKDENTTTAIHLSDSNNTSLLTSNSTIIGGINELYNNKEDVANKSTDVNLGTSDTLYPTQNAVKTYVDNGLSTKQDVLGYTPEDQANKSTDVNTDGNSNTKYPSVKAVKDYVDANTGKVGSKIVDETNIADGRVLSYDATKDKLIYKTITSGGGGGGNGVIIDSGDPTVNSNQPIGTLWLNTTSGELFACIDDTTDKNIWQGQLGTKVYPTTTNIVDIFGDGSGIALFQFNGNANDTGGNYDGTATNIIYDTGKFDQAAKFNGNAKIEVDFTSSGLKAVSFWYSASINDTTWHTILNSQNKNDNIIFAINNNNFSAYNGSTITIYTDNAIKDGNWHHVVLNNISGTNYDVWFDNTKVASNINLSYALDTLKVIGSDGESINEAYVGLLDEMRFFNRVLSDTEIQQLYNES